MRCLLLMLEVERSECCTKSKLHDSTNLCDSDIPPNLNHVKIDSYAWHLLFMLEVERKECCIESKKHRCRVVCRRPYWNFNKNVHKYSIGIIQIFRTNMRFWVYFVEINFRIRKILRKLDAIV